MLNFRLIHRPFLFASLLVLTAAPLAAQSHTDPGARAAALVRQMSLDEKVAQMQNEAPALPRLGIPAYDWWNEALHGVARSGHATVFPQAIGMAASWNAPLLEEIGDAISTEARAKFNQARREDNHSIYYGLTMWSPNINIDRDPRWGRGQETYGEDPLLTGSLGTAFVRGLQGSDPAAPKVDATAKHFAVHSGPEAARHNFNAQVSAHDLNDTYLPAFRQLVVDAKVNAVMCAYNAVNGEPACASPALLEQTLRRQWGFTGYVVSDCAAISDVSDGHHFAADHTQGAAVALRAGADLSCGKEYSSLKEAVAKGQVREAEIDAALTRLLTARIRLGLLDQPGTSRYDAIASAENNSAEHAQLALEAARASIVLLKNDHAALPFSSKIKTLAVVGPNARSLATLEGNYNAIAAEPSFPLEALEARAHVLYAQGAPLAEGFPVPVPITLFTTAQAGKRVPGLRAEYFSRDNFTGQPTVERIDRAIDFDWNGTSPDNAIPATAFAARWSGTITAPVAGAFSFGFNMAHCATCDDDETVRVWFDGHPVFDFHHAATHGRRAPTPRFDLVFKDVRPHALRIEYTHRAPHFGAGLTMNWIPPTAALRAEAVQAATAADAVVAFLGLSPELEGEEMPIHVEGFEGGDRTTIELPRAQADLVSALAATGKPLTLVLMSGSALALGNAATQAGAILEAWYPGQAGGQAIAETLFGDNNPAGRLPIPFYASTAQLPEFSNYSMQQRTYRYFSGQPLYGFGYGLSYAQFAYAKGQLSAQTLTAGDTLTATVEVSNTAPRAGDEVVECYLMARDRPEAPLRKLVGFKRVALAAGATRRVTLQVDARALSLVAADGSRSVEPGRYELFLGGGQPGEAPGLTLPFQIAGRAPVAP